MGKLEVNRLIYEFRKEMRNMMIIFLADNYVALLGI